MRFFRSERVGELIHRELGGIITREADFPRGALPTITAVEVDKKMVNAEVRISVIPSEKSTEVLAILERRAGEFQHLLNRKLNIKPMPRISFVIDHGTENAADIERILMDK